ncbi:MAG: TIGR03435 family protein, partial [Terriglobales bacterium]
QAPAAPAVTEFDAATLKISAPPGSPGRLRMLGFRADPQHLACANVTLAQMLGRAYNLEPGQIQGPAWIRRNRYVVTAETAMPVSKQRMYALLQPYLTREFHLSLRNSSELQPVFALVVAGGGSKLKPASGGAEQREMLSVQINPEHRTMRLHGQADMALLADRLGAGQGRPVVDMTGLEGLYAVDLTYALPQRALGPALAAKLGVTPNPGEASPPAASLASALQRQLGLTLEARNAPREMLVVEQATEPKS